VKESPFDHKTFQAIYEEFILSVKSQEGDEAWATFIREKGYANMRPHTTLCQGAVV
jgi:hypothetical protein